MTLDPKLLEILACPEDKGALLWFEGEAALYNPRLRRRYSVVDGIPVILKVTSSNLYNINTIHTQFSNLTGIHNL